MRLLYSLWFWAVFLTWGFFSFAVVLASMFLASRERTWAIAGALFRVMFGLWGIRWRVEGVANVDGRPAVVMPNHVNMFDHFLLAAANDTLPTIGIEKAKNFKLPIYGAMMRRWGSVPVEKNSGDASKAKATADAAREVMARDRVDLLTFPEGTRSRDGRVHGFKKGGFHIAIELGAPIQPISIVGTHRIMKGGDWQANPGHEVVMVYHPRIETAGRSKEDIPELQLQVRRAMLGPLEPEQDALPELLAAPTVAALPDAATAAAEPEAQAGADAPQLPRPEVADEGQVAWSGPGA